MSTTVNKMVYGSLVFTDNEIQDGELYEAISLLSDALEIGTLQVELYLRNEEDGAALLAFRRNDKLLYYYRDALRGTYYIESVQRTGMYTYQINANNAIALLEQSNHYGGIYTGQTVAELVADICTIPYSIQGKFSGIRLYGWLPVSSRRANLSQVLFAVGAHAKVDQNGVLRLEALWNGVSSLIPEENVFWGDKVTYESKVTEVLVLEHQYIKGNEDIKLFEGTAQAGDIIQFTEPASDLIATGFKIQSSGANYAVLSAGTGTLTGKKYVHTTRDIRAQVSEDAVANVIEVKEATLVSLTNSAAVAERLAGYYRFVEALEQDVIYGGERPGDVAAFQHPYGRGTTGSVKDTSIIMGGRLTAGEHISIGYVPPRFEAEELLDERVVLNGSGTWVVPDGVTSIRVVCIGGGHGGQAGFNGEAGGSTSIVVTTSEESKGGTWSTSASDGGKGGGAGTGAEGGKVYQETIDVTPGQIITYRCGGAGSPGSSNGAYGSPGGITTFGALSSDRGTSSAIGYVDPVTGEVFARPGVSGVSGAKGGRGSSQVGVNGVGENGEDVPPNKGGAGAAGRSFRYSVGPDREEAGGGGAGGGAAKGQNGGNPPQYTNSRQVGAGGAGASPPSPGITAGFGSGGNGGHGGGGGGGAGALYAFSDPWETGLPTGIWMSPGRAAGGRGSGGSPGGPGGIILYFGTKKTTQSGRFWGRGHQPFYSAGKRTFVV